jgi:DNA-binding transcriptional ArsR family regulator
MRKNYSRLIPKEMRNVVKVFVALGDQHRQRILLLFEQGERLNVGQIVSVAPISRSAVSHHLRVLKEAGVLKSEKVGKEVFFWINREYVEEVMKNVLGFIQQSY